MEDILFPNAPEGNIRPVSIATEEYNLPRMGCLGQEAHNLAR